MAIFQSRSRGPQILGGFVIIVIALISYCASSSKNPITGQEQHVSLTTTDEIALGLHAAPEMAAQFGGLDDDRAAQARVDSVGARLLRGLGRETPYQFDFHLLADRQTINAFALPGGQVFITRALYDRLGTEGQLGGALGHEMGHVIERHGAEHLAKQELTQGVVGGVIIGASDPNDPNSARQIAALSAAVAQLITLRYGRSDELEADDWGVELTSKAGYDPRSMLDVMRVLADASQGRAPPEFFSTHPNPDNRIERIEEAIRKRFPNGAPSGLER